MQTHPLANPTPTPFSEQPVGDLVARDYRYAEVFKQHGIDFCCGGGRSVRTACAKKGIAPDTIEQEYRQLTHSSGQPTRDTVAEMSIGDLLDHIESEHHAYIRRNIPIIRELTVKVARVHGHLHTELVTIAELFEQLADDLTQHLQDEERILFPFMRQMGIAAETTGSLGRPFFRTRSMSVEDLEDDHRLAGALMQRIRELSDNYTPPEYACNSYVVAYRKLEEFEADLHRHVHLENNVLFPKVARLERELLNRGV